MKTSKKLFAAVLALVLLIASFVPATFSWYDHNGSQTGDSMSYSRQQLPVSAGEVSVVTKKYRTENNKLWYDTKGNKEYGDSVSGTTSVAAKGVQYFGTTITNTGAAPAYVNLYLKDFTNSPNVKIGTLQPSLTDKGLSSSVHLKNKNMIRVYFQYDLANNWNTTGAKKYVVYKTKGGGQTCVEITATTPTNFNNKTTYYVDLADDTTEFFFASDGKVGGFSTTTFEPTIPWYRTQTITHVQPEKLYYLTGVADDTTFNAQYDTRDLPGGISVKTYFDTATINKNQHAYVTLNKGTNYTGESAAYRVNTGSNITVNENTGYVTTTNYSDSATITTTIKGSLGDETTVTTAVSNPSTLAGVPVALNVEVPGTTTNENNETVNGTAEIVWYIDNSAFPETSSKVQFESIYYTK